MTAVRRTPSSNRRARGPINKRACQRCRLGKIKCDGDAISNRSCSNCEPSACIYDTTPRKNKQIEQMKEQMDTLQQRIMGIYSDFQGKLAIKEKEKEVLCLLYESKEYFGGCAEHLITFDNLKNIIKQSTYLPGYLDFIGALISNFNLNQDKVPGIIESLERIVSCTEHHERNAPGIDHLKRQQDDYHDRQQFPDNGIILTSNNNDLPIPVPSSIDQTPIINIYSIPNTTVVNNDYNITPAPFDQQQHNNDTNTTNINGINYNLIYNPYMYNNDQFIQLLKDKINQKISSPPTVVDLNITAHDGEIHTIASTVDGSMFATGSADKTINVFDTETGNVKQTLTGPHQSIMHVSFNNTNEAIVCASSDNVARVWSLNTGRIAFTLTSHLGKVYSARFNCDSTRVITGSHDRTIKVWDIQRGYCSRTIYAYSSCNDVVSLDDYGTTLASGHLDNSLRFWDVKSGKDIKELTNIHLGQITSVCLSPDRTKVLTNSRDNSLKLIDLRTYQIEQTLKADGYKTGANWARVCFSPDGKYVAAAGKFSTPVTYNDDDLNAKADVKMSGYEFAANIMLSVNFLVSLIKKNWQNVKRFLCGLGDTIAQHVVEKRGIKNHDSYRTIRIGGFGLLIAGPVPAVWYRILDRYVKFENPITGLLARVALDQMVFAPTFIAGFFLIQGILEGKTKLQLTRKLEKAYLPALLNSYKIWPIVQLINFRFVPLDHRLLVVNTVALGWNTYLSVTNNKVQ
ncbi:20321_t:CDS:10 [Entrophospora sp. SA101]|nr:20321_t:CDS:10 [Entrophospora sp. SA101]